MAKKINPIVYRSLIYKNPLLLNSSYSLHKYTEMFVKLLVMYNYILNVLNRFLTINIFKHPFLLQNKIISKQISSGFTTLSLKKKRNKRLSKIWFQEYFRWNRFYLRNNKQYLNLAKNLNFKQSNKLFTKWNNFYRDIKYSQIDNVIYHKFLKNFFENKVSYNNKELKENLLPMSTPISQELRLKIKYPRSLRFFPISDIYIISDKYNLNIFISYLTPPVYTFRYLLAFYKKLLKYKFTGQRLTRYLISNYSNIISRNNFNVSRGEFQSFIKSYRNLFLIQKDNNVHMFNNKFIWFLKSNLQNFSDTKVNLFFFNNRDLFLYAVRDSKSIQSNSETFSILKSTYNEIQNMIYNSKNKSNLNILKIMFCIDKIYNGIIGLKFVNILAKNKKYIPALSSKMTVSMFLICLQQAIITGSAKALSDVIVFQFKRAQNQTRFYYYLKKIIYIFFRRYNQIPQYLSGIKIVITGRLNGRNRSNKRVISLGNIGLISKNQVLDYSKDYVTTRYGVIGIKVYLFF